MLLTRFEQENGHLAQVEVDEVFGFMCHITTEVPPHDAVPGGGVLLATLLLCACGTQPAETLPPPETVPTTDTIPEETQPLHSPLYLPDCSTEQLIEYFNEVVLDMEYSDGVGDVTLVQKWG